MRAYNKKNKPKGQTKAKWKDMNYEFLHVYACHAYDTMNKEIKCVTINMVVLNRYLDAFYRGMI